MSQVRLQRYLSQAGVCARRKAETLILEGRVAVNGKVVRTLGTKVTPGSDRVAVDGDAVYPEELFYILLNKPKACITAVSDPEGRPTVMDYLRGVPASVAPVGRLDYYTEGVLLLTNDGELAARLLSSRNHVEKTYHVKLRGHVSERELDRLRAGIRLDDGARTREAQIDRLEAHSKHDWLVVTLIEGKSRQIHRMFEALGHTVVKLQRVAFAGLTFHGLRVGDARELTQLEVNGLRDLVSLPKTPVARGKWTTRREDTELSRRARARARAAEAIEASEPGASEFYDPRDRPRQGRDKPGSSRGASGSSRGAPAQSRGTTARDRGAPAQSRGATAQTRGATAKTRGTTARDRSAPAKTRGATAQTRGATAKTRGAPAKTRGATAKTRGATAKTRGAPAKTRGTTAPPRGTTAPPRGTTARDRGAPATGRGGPAKGRSAPAAGRATPARGRPAPAKSRGAPAKSRGAPAKSRGAPAKSRGAKPTKSQGKPGASRSKPGPGRGGRKR